jgi:hypothetical protein
MVLHINIYIRIVKNFRIYWTSVHIKSRIYKWILNIFYIYYYLFTIILSILIYYNNNIPIEIL